MKRSYVLIFFGSLFLMMPSYAAQGDPISVTTNPKTLPSTVCTNQKNSVKYILQNNNTSGSLKLAITGNFSDKKNFWYDNECSNLPLAAGKTCNYTIYFQSDTPEKNASAKPQLIYGSNKNKMSLPGWNFTAQECAHVTGTILQGLPKATAINSFYDVIFEFQNSGSATAQDIKVIPLLDGKKDQLIIRENSCGNSLAAKKTCQVTGEFDSYQEEGPHFTGVTLSYQGGAVLKQKTTTTIGKPLLVAVGSSGYLATSQDGKTWQKTEVANNMSLTAITWSDDLQQYLAVGADQNGGIAIFSAGGPHWQSVRTKSVTPSRVFWNKTLSQFITVGKQGIIETSKDGKTWIRSSVPVKTDLNAIVWNEAAAQYVVVGDKGVILTSKEGVNWKQRSTNVSDTLTGIAWSNLFQQYVVVTTTKNLLLTSTDGKKWQKQQVDTFSQANYDVTWNSDFYQFVSVGDYATINVTDDQNGKMWINRYSFPNDLPGYTPNTLIWSHNLSAYFAVTKNSYLITSNNGVMWAFYLLDGDGSSPTAGRDIVGICDGVLLPANYQRKIN